MSYPTLMRYANWLYSFIHIPGTIAFLVWLYYYTITSNRLVQNGPGHMGTQAQGSRSGPLLYEARRRTMATCNLLAFVVFTLWPCMPPRLLRDPEYHEAQSKLARSYSFVDTVHGKEGASSVWTQNKFCNQYGEFLDAHTSAQANCYSGHAISAFRIFSTHWRYDYDHTSRARASKVKIAQLTIIQPESPNAGTTRPTSIDTSHALRIGRVYIPICDLSRNRLNCKPFHTRRSGRCSRLSGRLEMERGPAQSLAR